jgi:hypothetical protein
MMRAISRLAAVLALALVAAPAFAADPAADRFNEGLALLRSGDTAGACARFRASIEAHPSVGALARVAECEERDAHLVRAMEAWRHALDLARTSRDERVNDLDAAIRRLDERLPKARVVVPAGAPTGLRLRLDDADVAPAEVVPLDPGLHVLSVEAPQKRADELRFEVRADGKVIDLPLPQLLDELPGAPVPPPAPEPPQPPSPEPPALSGARPLPVTLAPQAVARPFEAPPRRAPDSGRRREGIVATTIGAVVTTAGLGFAIAATANKSAAGCNGFACPSEDAANTLRGAQTDSDVATAFLAVGVTGVFVGVVMLALAPSTAPSPPRVEIAPQVDRTSCGLAVGGRF